MFARLASSVSVVAVMLSSSVVFAETGRPQTMTGDPYEGRQDSIPVYDYVIVNTYPHDASAFTQGLVYRNGYLYEGTGLYGASSLRKVELVTGTVVKIFHLPAMYFGEGITIYRDTIVQLTWREHIGFAYHEQDTFELIDSFYCPTEGWGLTHNDTFLIMSDGTQTLYFLDPVTYDEVYTIDVTVNGTPLVNINELEFVQGMVYANIWFHDSIAIIDPANGVTAGWVNLNGILADEYGEIQNVLNGIAFDPDDARLFVTGKLWPELFEIEIEPVDYPPAIVSMIPSSPCSICVDDFLTLTVSIRDPDVEDTVIYTWSINGVVDSTFSDSFFVYAARFMTVDTVTVMVTDGSFVRTVSWQVYVMPWYFTTIDWHRFVSFRVLCNPNPCRDECQVVCLFGQAELCSTRTYDLSVALYDASGRLLGRMEDYRLEGGTYRFPLSVPGLSPGVYFLECRTAQYHDVEKLVILGR
jgi:glutamine cyclotransferase